jgi:twitching motility protein PilT
MATGGEAQGVNLHQLLKAMIDRGASDLHVTTGSPPQLRIDDVLVPLKVPALTHEDTQRLCYSVLTEEQRQDFERRNELDLSFGVKNLARFRANFFMQRGAVAGAFRAIPFKVLSFEELGLPAVVAELAARPRGLVLITGPTGSGKSTTLAAVIDKINGETRQHILTVEDPIEYLHPHKLSLVNQREVGSDTRSFKEALKYVLRQDPDVVLVGEVRDQETMEAALGIAETGHLVLATLHTSSAVQTIHRVVDMFPSSHQAQVRAQLSFVLAGVVTQQLLPRLGGPGRALALEVMIPNAAIRNLIREDKVHQIYSIMQTGQAGTGMQTLNQSLAQLVLRRVVSLDEALGRSTDADELRGLVEQGALHAPSHTRPR